MPDSNSKMAAYFTQLLKTSPFIEALPRNRTDRTLARGPSLTKRIRFSAVSQNSTEIPTFPAATHSLRRAARSSSRFVS